MILRGSGQSKEEGRCRKAILWKGLSPGDSTHSWKTGEKLKICAHNLKINPMPLMLKILHFGHRKGHLPT